MCKQYRAGGPRRRRWLAMALLAASVWWCGPAHGEDLSFHEAVARMERLNETLGAAKEDVNQREEEAAAAKGLRLPSVELNVEEITLDAPVVLRISNLPLGYKFQDNTFSKATIEAVLPLYTGGKIEAAQAAAEARVEDAKAESRKTEHNLLTELAIRYFGLSLTRQARAVQAKKTDAMKEHAYRAQRLMDEGIVARVEYLNANVAYEDAKRELEALDRDIAIVAEGLKNIVVECGDTELTTPLFVLRDVETSEMFQGYVDAGHPVMDMLEAKKDLAHQGVVVEKSEEYPTIYAFAMKELFEHYITKLEPEAAAGIGLKYTLFDGHQTKHKIAAAEAQERKVAQLESKYRRDLKSLVVKRYEEMNKALEQFDTFASTLTLAEENLRVRSRAFEEDLATSVEVVDASVSLARAQLGRFKASYDFDTALFQLLEASGRSPMWQEYINRAEPVMEVAAK